MHLSGKDMLRNHFLAVIALCLFLTPQVVGQEEPEQTTYIIQPGDTLLSIARRYDTTVSELAAANGIVNTATIYWGQRLVIPSNESEAPTTPDVTPSPTPTPTPTINYTVRSGDTLYRIAVRHQTTISELRNLNPGIQNSNLVFVGQQIIVPNPDAPATSGETNELQPTNVPAPSSAPVEVEATLQEPTATDVATELPAEPTLAAEPAVEPNAELEYGIEANLLIEDPASTAKYIGNSGVGWAKQLLSWNSLEPVEGVIDFATLDALIETLEGQNVHILLTITNAPNWARTIQEETGPPDDFQAFANFLGAISSRYAGRVAAYEIWNEPNLRNRWRSTVHPISATSYVDMLRGAHDAIKAADPEALVISAGLAPTGFNDALGSAAGDFEVNAIDDRIFLSGMYAAGLVDVADGIGVHPIGFANPPDVRCCEAVEGVETHFNDPHFYFLDTLDAYRQVQIDNNDLTIPLWVTRFGWGTVEDLGVADEFNIFVSYTSLEEQAQYLTRAFEIADELGYVGPMFAFSLNGCQAPGIDGPTSCYYGLIGPRNEPRLVFNALQAIAQPGEPSDTIESTEEPESTETITPPEATEESDS